MTLNTPLRSNATPLSSPLFKSKLIFLHEWWLVKPQNHCKSLAIGGIASMERERMFFSSVIVKRHEPNVVETDDGVMIMFRGLINVSRTSQNGFSSEVCRRFSVGFPHDWKNHSSHCSGNDCKCLDRVIGFDDSNASSHRKTADETSKEATEAEGNDKTVSLRSSQPQINMIYNGGLNGISNVDEPNVSAHKKPGDETSLKAMEAEGNDNIASRKFSQPQVDAIYKRVSNVDGSNASCHKKTTDVTSYEATKAQDNNNIVSPRLFRPQAYTCNDKNRVSSVSAAESRQCLMSVFEFDPNLEQSSAKSPLYAKKLEFDQLSIDRKEKKRIKQKIVKNTDNLCSKVLTRNIAKKSDTIPKKDGKVQVKCFTTPVRRSPRLHNCKK